MSDTIRIEYENGQMEIYLNEFLMCERSISKVRKLVKIINKSYTPEVIEQVKEFIEQKMNTFDDEGEKIKNQYKNLENGVSEIERQLNIMLSIRAKYKRCTDEWKQYNCQVRCIREDLKVAKANARLKKREFNDLVRTKSFFIKLLTEVF